MEEEDQDQQGSGEGRENPRPGPLRPRQGQGTDPGIPCGAATRRQGESAYSVPGGATWRRQDLAGPIDRTRDQTQEQTQGAGRRARRIRNSRPSSYLHWLDARQDPAKPDQDRGEESTVPARRSRQDGAGLPWRSVVGAAGSARPRAEPYFPGSLYRS